jgi:hypothetical protein
VLYEIKSWRDGRVLFSGEYDSLARALRAAIGSDANLADANLTDANLAGAKGIDPWCTTPLLMLLEQPGPIRAYKLVDADGQSPINDTRILYEIGKTYEEPKANTDVNERCGAGLNIATLPWCLQNWQSGWRIFVVEFTAADIAAIPTATDGKFRVRKFTVVGEKKLAQYGLGRPKPKKASKPRKKRVSK